MPYPFLNDPHPWTEGVHAELTLVDVVANGTIPARAAALLWWAVERGASLFTAGGPSGAGKTTLANALLAFLPEGAGIYAVAEPVEHPWSAVVGAMAGAMGTRPLRVPLPPAATGGALLRVYALPGPRDGCRTSAMDGCRCRCQHG